MNIDIASILENIGILQIYIYEKGKIITKKEINEESNEYKIILQWITNQQHAWESCYCTYTPNILILSSDFSLNISSSEAIFVYKEQEYRKHITEGDFVYLRNVLVN